VALGNKDGPYKLQPRLGFFWPIFILAQGGFLIWEDITCTSFKEPVQ